MNVIVSGNGPRYELISNAINDVKTFSETKEYQIYIGEGIPNTNVNLWITKNINQNFNFMIENLKSYFDSMYELEIIGVDNFESSIINQKMCILLYRDGTIKTFQDQNDLNIFIFEILDSSNLL